MRGTIPTSRHGEGGSGGYTPLIPMKYLKKKLEKKIRKKIYFLCSKFFIYIFAYIKTFTYLCILVDVEVGLHITHEVKK